MMVRRRKQLKPSSAQAGVVKATLTGLLDTRAPLVNLPAEIQGIITSYVRQSLIDAIHTHQTIVLMRLL